MKDTWEESPYGAAEFDDIFEEQLEFDFESPHAHEIINHSNPEE